MLSPKRAPEETLPANLTEFFPDEELESRRLERVQGWALLFAAVVAVALPLYWLHEPARQSESANYFDKNAAERGEVLFSNPAMPKYEAATSLQCANCHGLKGQGGPVPFTVVGEGRWSGRRRRSTPCSCGSTRIPNASTSTSAPR